MRKEPRSTRLRLLDIQEAIEQARKCVGTRTADELAGDRMHRLATERAIEIISEASKHIPADLKVTEPDIPWRDIAGMGSVLRHDYEQVETDVIWATVKFRLDALESAVTRLLGRLGGSS